MLTVLSTLGPHRLDAGRCTVTSRFRCRSFDRRYVVGALSTGRCLPAVAPRVLIMGDEVRSRSSSPDSHFNRFPSHSTSENTPKSCRPRVWDRTMVPVSTDPSPLASFHCITDPHEDNLKCVSTTHRLASSGAGTPRKNCAQSVGEIFPLTSSFIEQPARDSTLSAAVTGGFGVGGEQSLVH